MNKSVSISDTIRELRRNAGYTQSQVSQKLNIQRQTYCNYETSARTPPLEIITALAELYDVSIDYLVRGTEHTAASAEAPAETALSPREKKLLSDFSSLPEEVQSEVLSFIQFKKLFHGCE
jgi:transcriptional regulator with XRE-family HTH domain